MRVERNGAKKAPFSISIVGDIRLDIRAKLQGRSFLTLDQDITCFTPVTVKVSGTAFNMAQACTKIFETVHVLARIGEDDISPLITEATSRIPAKWHFVVDHYRYNQPIVIIRDASKLALDGVRLLISGSPAPYHQLSPTDVDNHREIFSTTNVVFLDGYSLFSSTSRAAIRRASEIARESEAVVCVDIVPHNIDKRIEHAHVVAFMGCADIVIVEARTLCRILGITPPRHFDDKHLPLLTRKLSDPQFSNRTWVLRFGAGDISRSALHRPGLETTCYDTGYAHAPDKAGFGDQLAAQDIMKLLTEHRW